MSTAAIDQQSVWDIPQALYDSEINFSISCAFDGGWVIKLGNDGNRWNAEMRVEPPLKFEDASTTADAPSHRILSREQFCEEIRLMWWFERADIWPL